MLIPVSHCVKKRRDLKNRSTPQYKSAFDRLVADMAKNGQRNPITGVRVSTTEFEVVNGYTRLLVKRLLGDEFIDAIELTGDLSESRLLVEEWVGNNSGEEFDIHAQAELFTTLMTLNGWTAAELCDSHPVFKPSAVSKALSVFERLIAELKAKVTEMGGRRAYAFSRLAQERQLDAYTQWGHKKVEVVEKLVAEALGKKPRKAKPQTVKHDGVILTFPAEMNREQLLEAVKLAIRKIA